MPYRPTFHGVIQK